MEYFDSIIRKEIESGQIAGANLLLMKDGKELAFGNYGMADKENGKPMERDCIFRMYSMSKPVTAAAIMLLFERGCVDLYEPVSRYLPGFKGQKVLSCGKLTPVYREATIRDMLNMTSGLPYPGDDTEAAQEMDKLFYGCIDEYRGNKSLATVELMNEIGSCPLAFQPGEKWMYGFSADVLGAVVEVVTGKRFGEFLQEELFKPLGMKDTDFVVPADKRGRFAQNYEYFPDTDELKPYLGNNFGFTDFSAEPIFESGGAGLVSTIDDYYRFAQMLCNDGTFEDKRILGKKTVDFMRTNQLTDKQSSYLNWDSLKGYGYGNLMRVLINKAEGATNASLGEFGWDGWTGNYCTMNPSEHMVFLYFIQKVDTGFTETIRRLRAIAYSAL